MPTFELIAVISLMEQDCTMMHQELLEMENVHSWNYQNDRRRQELEAKIEALEPYVNLLKKCNKSH